MSAIAVSALTSCTKEKTISNHLSGEKWKVTAIGGSIVETDKDGKVTTETPEQDLLNAVFSFDEESMVTVTYADGIESTKFWNIKEEVIYLNGVPKYVITEDSSKKQVWSEKETEKDVDSNGKVETTVTDITYTLEKQ